MQKNGLVDLFFSLKLLTFEICLFAYATPLTSEKFLHWPWSWFSPELVITTLSTVEPCSAQACKMFKVPCTAGWIYSRSSLMGSCSRRGDATWMTCVISCRAGIHERASSRSACTTSIGYLAYLFRLRMGSTFLLFFGLRTEVRTR